MIRLHDTMAREKRPFVPLNPQRITMYVCGPTVYGRAHIGNARPAVVFDTLARLIRHELSARGYRVLVAIIIARLVSAVNQAASGKASGDGT